MSEQVCAYCSGPRCMECQIELKYMAIARKDIEARERAGLEITPEWLDALERKYMAMGAQELQGLSIKHERGF